MTRSPYSLWLWPVISVLVALTAAAAVIRLERPPGEPLPTVAEAALEPAPAPAPDPAAAGDPAAPVLIDTIGRDDSIYLSLKRNGVADLELAHLTDAMGVLFDASRSKPGDSYRLAIGRDGKITSFSYVQHSQPEQVLHVERTAAGEFSVRQIAEPLDTSIVALQVTIEDNLSNAIAGAGESVLITDLLADRIFGSVIDFNKDPRKGDRIGLVLRKLFKDGKFVRDDRVLLARYEGEIVSQAAVFYETEEGSGYYDENGKSVERMFLLSPLSYRRISSGFSHKRFHPILKRNMPHLGMDFAADKGTRVWATARGTVRYAGRKGGYGKLVEIEHPNGYRTRYAHLSRISVRKGQRVDKYEIVGRVGSTGRATGPHLHYELLRNGRHRNPAIVNREAKVTPLPEDRKDHFFAYRDRLVARAAAAGPAVALQNPEP